MRSPIRILQSRLGRLRLPLLLLAFCCGQAAFAGLVGESQFSGYDSFPWGAGSNPIPSRSSEACIVSTNSATGNGNQNGNGGNSGMGGKSVPYQLRVVPDASTATSLPAGSVDFYGLDLNPGGAGGELDLDVWSAFDLTYLDCTSTTRNARISATVRKPNLYGLLSGTYTSSYTVEARQGTGTSPVAVGNLIVTVEIPKLVEVSNLNGITLPGYTGQSTGVGRNESFCVYSNSAAGYTVTPSSPTSILGDSGSFALKLNSDTTKKLKYVVFVSDTPTGLDGTQVANGASSATFTNSSLSRACTGGDNAAVYVQILKTDLDKVPAGTYSETLTLTVAPE